MKLFARLAGLVLLGTLAGHGTTLVVDPADFATIDLDIDGDGSPEITSFDNTDPAASIVFLATDVPDEFTFPLPGSGTLPAFASLVDLAADPMFSGTASLIAGRPTGTSDAVGFITIDITATPILATWWWGTSGIFPEDPHHLTGWVLDATAHAADPAAPITIYYHDYGAFNEGDSATVSLVDTMVPIPEPAGLWLLALAATLWCRRRDRA